MNIFQKLSFVLLFLFYTTISYATDTLDEFTNDINNWSKNLKGTVVSVSNNSIRVKLDKQNKIIKGSIFDITRYGEELFNPVTKKSLGKKVHTIGTFTVNSSDGLNLSGVFKGSQRAKVGDKAVVKTPIPIKITFSDLDSIFSAEILYAVFKDRNFIESKESDYNLTCVNNNGEAECNFRFQNTDIISSKIPVVGSHDIDVTKIEVINERVKKNIVSTAIGYPFGVEKGIYVILADKKSITFYKIDGDKLILEKNISLIGDFDDIINIEVVDNNNNNIDEIYISNIKYGTRVESYVYEYIDDTFNLEIGREPYLFRTYYSNNGKTLMAQEFDNGDFTSPIYEYDYIDDEYRIGKKLGSLSEYRLYGYGDSSIGEISYNAIGSILVKDAQGKLQEYKGFFSDSPHKLKYSRQFFKTTTTGGIDNVDEEILSIPIYPRVIEVTKGKFFLQSNEPVERKTTGNDKYKKSYYGLYSLIDDKIATLWQSEDKKPVIIESDIVKDKENVYILLFFKSKKSSIEVLKLKLS